MNKILFFLAAFAILSLSNCKKDKDSNDPEICSANWDVATGDTYDNLIDAYNAYIEDMSVANCNAYKEAYLDYIDVLEPFLECASWTAAELEEIQDMIDEAEDAVSSLTCE